ncbi:MAG: 50S ribosomal protein L17 [Candidatus Omnitrophota bacterium]
MRHRKKVPKLSRSRSQRRALRNSLVRAVIINERIKTTEAKAKAARSWVEKLITIGKDDSLSNRRRAYRILGDHALTKRLFKDVAPRFKNINGGYTRMFRLGKRKGDGATYALFELTKLDLKDKKSSKRKPVKEPEAKETVQASLEPKKKGFFSGMRKAFKKDNPVP